MLITLPTPTKTGYVFGGWFRQSDFSDTALGSTFSTSANITIYAKWTAGSYKIIYSYNGATGGSSSAEVTYTTGGTAVTLPSPTRTGYTFGGWYESASLTGTSLTGSYTTSENRTLYAKWTAVNYTVSYSSTIVSGGSPVPATSGTVPVDNSNYNIGQTMVVSANTGLLTRTGYYFAGWVTNEDGSGVAYSASQTITFGAANITLYPKWLPATYTITYNKNGASGELAKATDTYTTLGSSITLPGGGTMAKSGYTFGGWSLTANGSALSNAGYTVTQDVTLYAVWTLATYTITYDLSGGDSSAPANQTANFTQEVIIAGIGASSKTGHWFAGWNTASDKSGSSYGAGQRINMPIGGLTLYAVWVPNTYRISYNANGGTGGPNLAATEGFDTATFGEIYVIRNKGNITRSGYTFAHWTINVDGSGVKYAQDGDNSAIFTSFSPTENTIFYAQWTAVVYNFTFNPEGGNNSPVAQNKTIGQVITLPSPGTKTGYTFSGWSDGENSYPANSDYVVGAAGVNFEATWTPNVYSVLFDWQGGIGVEISSASYTVGTGNLSLPTVGSVTKDGYTFAGWSETAGGPAVANFQPTANDILYAVWDDGNYNLSLEEENGNSAVARAVARTSATTLPTPTRAGFTFQGWYTSAVGGDKIGDGGDSYTPGRSKSMYARWVQNSLAGVDVATLESANEFTADDSTAIDTVLTHVPSGTSARIQVPAGALPNGTKVNIRYFRDTTRQSSLIPGDNNYFLAVLVSWLNGSGSTATVPSTATGKPIQVTLNNSSIKAGAMVYMIVGSTVTELGRATEDGTVTVTLTDDPELVVAATAPASPSGVTVTSGDGQAVISWSAPVNNGGSDIVSYTVAASSGGGTCTTATTSCTITGLTNARAIRSPL